ncbi:MAG: DUF4386 family protein [Anaerolineae bacterium]|nr:DUF4386 family protein [Anaerolineae bacterium]
MANQVTHTEITGSAWKGLYRIGGAAILIAVVIFRRNFGAELVGFRGFGIFDVPAMPPSSAIDWFTLLQNNRFVGLALLDVVDIVNYALVGLMFLALYGALRRANRSAMTVATAFGLVGIAVYFASNQAFAMLSLSDQYAAATDDAQRAMLLAAGQALLAIHNPGTIYQGLGIHMSLLLVVLAGLIMSIVMLRSSIFGKTTAWTGIIANGCVLGYFVALAFAPALCALPHVISAPFRVVWYVLIARRLFQLGSSVPEKGAR